MERGYATGNGAVEGLHHEVFRGDAFAGEAGVATESESAVVFRVAQHDAAAGDGGGAEPSEDALAEASAALEALTTPVDGGRALQTSLLSVLFTDDGRVLVGSVPVDTLVEVAAGSGR